MRIENDVKLKGPLKEGMPDQRPATTSISSMTAAGQFGGCDLR